MSFSPDWRFNSVLTGMMCSQHISSFNIPVSEVWDNWKWQTDLICHFPTRKLSFFCVFLPGTNAQTQRFANTGTSRSVSLPLYFDGADNARLLFLYLLPSLFSFIFNIQGEDKMVAGGDENKSHPSLFIRHEKDTQ